MTALGVHDGLYLSLCVQVGLENSLNCGSLGVVNFSMGTVSLIGLEHY